MTLLPRCRRLKLRGSASNFVAMTAQFESFVPRAQDSGLHGNLISPYGAEFWKQNPHVAVSINTR